MRLWQGAIAISHYEGIVSPAYTVCIPSVHINPDFISYLLKRPAALRMFYSLSQGNSKDTLILKYPLFSTIKFSLPAGREQYHIARLLRCVDQLIDAEKRKLELLEKKREELLQCVFSQRLRLNGCTEDCPQYSLAELEMNGDIHMGRGKVISAIQMKKNPGIYPVYSSSSKNNGEMGRYGEYMFDHELVTWSIDGGGHVFYRAKHRFSITNVCGYMQVRNNIDCSFLAYQMMFKHSKLHFDYTSKALPSLIKNMYDLSMPSLYEQERIGRLFKVFDSLIEFISHKIELTEQKKKALLQTMFL